MIRNSFPRACPAGARLLLALLLAAYLLAVAIAPPFAAPVNGRPQTSHLGRGLVVGVWSEDLASTDSGVVHVLYAADGGLSADGSQIWHQDSASIPSVPEENDRFGETLASADFNGDGEPDLAVGAPTESVSNGGTITGAGVVHVLYGADGRLGEAGNQLWYQDSDQILDFAEPADRFGTALAVGDFNGDGYGDLAIGVPFEDVAGTVDAGAIHVLYGSAAGLRAAGNHFLHQAITDIADEIDPGDNFGFTLTAADFDGDGFDDLAIGAPGEDLELATTVVGAGVVHVIYGSVGGLSSAGNQLWHQSIGGIADDAEETDRFGRAMTVGDFNGDGFGDLVIGVPFESFEDEQLRHNVGVVHVLHGSSAGLSAAASQIWHQDSADVRGGSETGDRFGSALAAGDFDGDGFDDLAVGVPEESLTSEGTTVASAGAVNLFYGSGTGLSANGNQFWHQDVPGVTGVAEEIDRFGASLAAGAFNSDAYADLSVGVTFESLEVPTTIVSVGAVNVFYGSGSGLNTDGNQFWYQGSAGVSGIAEEDDHFGSALVGLHSPPRPPGSLFLPFIGK